MLALDSFVLRRGSAGLRLGAARRLGGTHDERAIPPLAAALEDHSGRVAEAAAKALAEIGGARAASAAVEHLHGCGRPARPDATDAALIALGATAVDPLLERLTRDRPRDLHTLWLLGEIGDRRSTAALLERLRAGDAGVRRSAAEALGKVGDASAVAPLVLALADVNRGVAGAARRALDRLDPRWAESAAASGCQRELAGRLTNADAAVRRGAVAALLSLGGEAVPELISYLAEQLEQGVEGAAYDLASTHDPLAVAPLVAALEGSSKRLRPAAACALGRLDLPAATEVLERLLGDGDDEQREAALEGLTARADAAPFELLVEALEDPAPGVRCRAARVLGYRGDRRAVAALERALESRHLEVVGAVAEALERLGVTPIGLQRRVHRAVTVGRWREVVALGRSAVVPLCKLLEGPLQPPATRLAAIELLGRIGDPRALEPLIRALANHREAIRAAAVVALLRMRRHWSVTPRKRRVVAELLGCMARNLPPEAGWVRRETKLSRALREIGATILKEMGKEAVEPLSEVLADTTEDLPTRAMAAAALGCIGDEAAVESLAAELDADDLLLRGVSAAALSNIGGLEAHLALANAGPAIFTGDGDVADDGGADVGFDFDFDIDLG